MFRFVHKNPIRIVSRRDSIETHPCFSQNPCLKSISTTPKGKETPKASDFTVSYLVNSCGLSTDSALRASKRFRLKTTENPDSVLSLFKSYGFTDTQIAKVISGRPHFLHSHPAKTLKPKMDFLRDVGFSITDLTFVLSKNPAILTCSIDDRLVPAYGFLKSILGTDEAVIFTTKREPWLLHKDHKMMGLRIQALRDQGVLDSDISALIKRKPRIFLTGHPDRFTEAVTKVKAMGFKPLSFLFYSALGTILSISESKWEEKFELYRSFGWSKDDILSALKKQPEIMLTSQGKIRKMMDFFSKEPGLGLSILSCYPHLLWRSLEKAIIPRYSVIHVLTSQGLLNKDVNFSVICSLKKEKFLEKYVIQYQDKVPQVLQAYRGKMVIGC